MEMLTVLYFYFCVTLTWSMAKGNNSTTTTPNILQPKTISCVEGFTNGKVSLTCSGLTRIPTINETNHNHEFAAVLDLSGKNHLQTVETEEFYNAMFINVVTIKMDNCNIRTIQAGAFRGLESLVEVHLQNNRIEKLNMEMFEGNNNLQIVLLSGNHIHQFLGTQFPKLPLLKKIDLRNGSIFGIPTNAFANFPNLRELDLRDNKIRRLNWNTFQTTTSLTHLYLANNEWECDCHMSFLQAFLKETQIDIAPSVICKGPEKFANILLNAIPKEDLTCSPQIIDITPIGSDTSISAQPGGDLIVYAVPGRELLLDCAVDGYPQPEISWTKDNRPIDRNSRKFNDAEVDPDSNASRGLRPDFRHNFTKHLTIFNTSQDDIGSYECSVYHKGQFAHRVVKSVFLNLTNIQDDLGEIIVDGGGGRTWVWILLGLLVLLVIALLIVGILIWKKKEKQRQLKYRAEMLNKFKGSEIVIDEAFSTPRKNEPSSTVPLLSSNNIDNNAIPVSSPRNSNSVLPDVALRGNESSVHPTNLSPVLFSPRPPSSELRRHFFTSQQENSMERPGSAMSLVYYGPPLQPRPRPPPPGQNPQQFYYHNRPQSYRMAQFALRRPWGSSQSLVHPDSYGRPRPLLMRQFSAGPGYATMTRFQGHPHRESVFSMASEPGWHHQSLDRAMPPSSGIPSSYVTLPRNFVHSPQPHPSTTRLDSGFGPSISPTESTYSEFSYASTLPPRWRTDPNAHPVIYSDSVGPRTTADGGSNLSLNKIGVYSGDSKIDTLASINSGLMSPTKGKIKPGGRSRPGSSSMTPGSLRGTNDFFSFEPIQEVEGSEVDLGAKLDLNTDTEIDEAFSKLQSYPQSSKESVNKFQKKKAPQISAIPSRSRKPIRTFQYSKMEGLKDYDFDESLDGDQDRLEEEELPSLPNSPMPELPVHERRDRLKSSIENIIEKVEGTEV